VSPFLTHGVVHCVISQVCEYVLGLQKIAGDGFSINATDSLFGETGINSNIVISGSKVVRTLSANYTKFHQYFSNVFQTVHS